MPDRSAKGNLGDYLARRSQELDLGRGDQLVAIQELLELWYPGQVHALSLNLGVLRLVTANASIASEIRMRQLEIISIDQSIRRLSINIATG